MLLGASGSICPQTLDAVKHHSSEFGKLIGLASAIIYGARDIDAPPSRHKSAAEEVIGDERWSQPFLCLAMLTEAACRNRHDVL